MWSLLLLELLSRRKPYCCTAVPNDCKQQGGIVRKRQPSLMASNFFRINYVALSLLFRDPRPSLTLSKIETDVSVKNENVMDKMSKRLTARQL